MFVFVFSLLVYGIYNKNALNSQHLFVFLSHPYEFNIGLGSSIPLFRGSGPLGVELDAWYITSNTTIQNPFIAIGYILVTTDI